MASSNDNGHPGAPLAEATTATAPMQKRRSIRVRKRNMRVGFKLGQRPAQKKALAAQEEELTTDPTSGSPIQSDLSDFYPVLQDWHVLQDWQKKRIQNSRAAIRRLPNELLLMIMKEVAKDPLDLYCLRQAAHFFADLFSDLSFRFHHKVSLNETLPLTPWRFEPITRDKEGRFIWHKPDSYHPLGAGGKERAFKRLFPTTFVGIEIGLKHPASAYPGWLTRRRQKRLIKDGRLNRRTLYFTRTAQNTASGGC